MSESAFPSFVIPGTYIRVLSEGLIRAGGFSVGNVGIVGTAAKGFGVTETLSSFKEGVEKFGEPDAASAGTLNLVRGLELLYRNGARTVYAVGLEVAGGAAPGNDAYAAAFDEIVKENVHILVAPELATSAAKAVLKPLVAAGEDQARDMIAVVGADGVTKAEVDAAGVMESNPRLIISTPGPVVFDRKSEAADKNVALAGRYSAPVVAGLLSSLAPHISPTNKVLPGVEKLATRFTYGNKADLVERRFLVLEERQGVRVVRGVTTDEGAFKQITTRRIVDFAKAGMRLACDPFIGKLNNTRVRAALQACVEGFLTLMLQNEALTDFKVEVSATRDEEIQGIARVNALLKPTFSIDYIAVTLNLQ